MLVRSTTPSVLGAELCPVDCVSGHEIGRQHESHSVGIAKCWSTPRAGICQPERDC
jgi:hypothetical protein